MQKTDNINSFKGRAINYALPVYIYRNLTTKAISYSIRQKGLVVAHTDAININDAEFIVSKKGQQRVIKEKQKNVHAYIKGYVSRDGTMGTNAIEESKIKLTPPLPTRVKYNPYLGIGFYTDENKEVTKALGVIINKKGVFAAYVS